MKILLATVPSDSHTWNLVFMQLFLEENDCEVINLGSCTPIDLIIEKAYSEKPELIVVSSINGHANIEGVELVKQLRQHQGLAKVKLVIGGKLGTKGDDNYVYKEKLLKAGFTTVFDGGMPEDDFKELKSLITSKKNKFSELVKNPMVNKHRFFSSYAMSNN